jgi:GR25 family glycosyltransferase involved in LPS biosynthesis
MDSNYVIENEKKFNTYVINLKKDTEKLERFIKNIEETNIASTLSIYDGLLGKEATEKDFKRVGLFCRMLFPRSLIGCGLSHLYLIDYFLENDENDFCLILEDDVIPLFRDMKHEIKKIMNDLEGKKWDIVKLLCFGDCNFCDDDCDTSPMVRLATKNMFSTANCAYLVSKAGARKIRKMKVHKHLDVQYTQTNLIMYNSKYPLFRTYIDKSSTTGNSSVLKKIFDIETNYHSAPLYWFIDTKLLYVPIIDYELSSIDIIYMTIAFVVILYLYKKYSKTQ